MKKYLAYLSLSGLLVTSSLLTACSKTKIAMLENLEQNQANLILLQLEQNKIMASKHLDKNGLYSIWVPPKQEIKALEILRADGQPMPKHSALGDVFKKDSFISSPLEEQARFMYALQEQISNMIAQMDGVVHVSTQVSLPPPNDNLWQSEVVKPSAAVFIKYKEGYHLEIYINRIKQLVAASVPGLSAEHVEVVLMRTS